MAQDTTETINATITVTNSEACLISAMLTSGDKDTIATITDKLDPADFANTLLARIFATLQELVNHNRPTDASTVLNILQAKGNRDGLADDQHHIMTELVTLKIVDLHLADYARQVASTSYRRQYLGPDPRKVDTSGVGPQRPLRHDAQPRVLPRPRPSKGSRSSLTPNNETSRLGKSQSATSRAQNNTPKNPELRIRPRPPHPRD